MRRPMRPIPVIVAIAFATLLVAPALAGVEDGVCIDAEFCEDPCPALTCESDADCEGGEICAVSTETCCATPSCFCDPATGEWVCAGACGIGIQICVVPEETTCIPVPATSAVGLLVLTGLAAAGMALAARRRSVGS